MAGALLRLTAAAALLTTSCCFVAPRKTTQKVTATRAIFDDDDGSIWDTLFRYGPLPTGIRVFRPEVYEEKVNELMETTGRTRLEAQRATDFYFNDPNGFGVQEIREIELGEKVDYSKKSGVQNRPIFSAFWASWCFYFFFIFLPARVGELGGVNPTGFDFGGPGPGGIY
ncbi:hypothetical protein SO694_00037049 [Aureococcus anophagefferens]|uniref:Uncharacterized protein n=1 Tax=Aureococcus anophagefferens TaxID=44056 RepID=A0ABR1FKT9_AURAN|nr:hypothetical protein JL722_10723 [Aureococcus anophagefferens]|mmetsp:Transcript_17715/g.61227  ORF Transcript_17715/g.61227 Transcript_17715/m.61227 type:complete len:170 (+) Transcript_17715:58-567(+)